VATGPLFLLPCHRYIGYADDLQLEQTSVKVNHVSSHSFSLSNRLSWSSCEVELSVSLRSPWSQPSRFFSGYSRIDRSIRQRQSRYGTYVVIAKQNVVTIWTCVHLRSFLLNDVDSIYKSSATLY
jgi:hypothetical protein